MRRFNCIVFGWLYLSLYSLWLTPIEGLTFSGGGSNTATNTGGNSAIACGAPSCSDNNPYRVTTMALPDGWNTAPDGSARFCHKYKISRRTDTEFTTNSVCKDESAEYIVIGSTINPGAGCNPTCTQWNQLVDTSMTFCANNNNKDNNACDVSVGNDDAEDNLPGTSVRGVKFKFTQDWYLNSVWPWKVIICLRAHNDFPLLANDVSWRVGYGRVGEVPYTCEKTNDGGTVGPQMCATTPSPTTPSPTTPSPTTPSPTTPSPTTPSPTTPSPTTPSPTTPSPTTPSPTTPSPTTPSPTTPSPTTPSPTTTAKPSPAPTYISCGEFGLDATRRADFMVLSDMSEDDGSYNDACDYYVRDPITVGANNRLNKNTVPTASKLLPGRLRIGATMSFEFDLIVNSQCTEANGCDVIHIGNATEFYPLIQLVEDGGIRIKTNQYATDGTIEVKTYTSGTGIVSAGGYTRVTVVWSHDSLVVTYGNTVITWDDTTNPEVRDHPADATNYWDAPDADTDGTLSLKMYAALGDTVADATIKHLCIKSSWTPDYWRVFPTYCQAKQNMVAEAITALKGHDGMDNGEPWKNVRYGYIEFDRDGATLQRKLTDPINVHPLSDDDMLDEFIWVQERECGDGTNDETDLCAALEATFDEFDRALNTEFDSFTPEREKKILIVSHNEHNGNPKCSDGTDLCEKFENDIHGGSQGDNTFGVSMYMINIDGTSVNTYELCLVMNDEDRIDDITTNSHLLYSKDVPFGGSGSPNSNRDNLILMVQDKLCDTEPTPNPTADPTPDPTTPSPTTPSPTTPSPTTPSPTTPSPTTPSPTTPSPTTPSPTTPSPTTPSPTTPSPTTPSPTTPSPTTPSPTTPSPTTPSPTTPSPTTPSPTTPSPTTPSPTTPSPTTPSPTTPSPTTPSPTTPSPTTPSPTTPSPTTPSPTTPSPTTPSPTTPSPTTPSPTTPSPTTPSPTTPSPTTPSPITPPTKCPKSAYMDLVIMNDISCRMTVQQCKDIHEAIAESFSYLRFDDISGTAGQGKHYFRQRVGYVEFASGSTATTLSHFEPQTTDFTDKPINTGTDDNPISDPAAMNEFYKNLIIGRGTELCTESKIAAREGDPALAEGIRLAVEELFDQSSLELNRDRDMIIYSSCAVHDRAHVCDTYYQDIRHALDGYEKVSNRGINVNMVNYKTDEPQVDEADVLHDHDTYLGCLVEWDPDTRIHVTPQTNLNKALGDSVCEAPTNTPTTDPTIDPTQHPSKGTSAKKDRLNWMIEPMDGLNKKFNHKGSENKLFALYTSYSLWIFAAIVCVFSLNVVVCCCVKIWCGKSNIAKSKIYGFISNDVAAVDSDDSTDSDYCTSDDEDQQKLV